MKGKVCVVTGGTSGIGRATALELGRQGTTVIVLGRNTAAGHQVIGELNRIQAVPTTVFFAVDLANPNQVRDTAQKIVSTYPQIDLLINNAGARYDRFQANEDGLELTFACNHLGHFLLTALLLDRLLAAPAARVLTVASGSHSGAPSGGAWLMTRETYDRRQAYARSKKANIVFSAELARRLIGTSAISCAFDPGGVASHFARNNGLISWARHLLSHGLKRDLVPPTRAAQDLVLICNLEPAEALNGRYFRRDQPLRVGAAEDVNLAHELWDLSLRLSELRDDISPNAAKILHSRTSVRSTP